MEESDASAAARRRDPGGRRRHAAGCLLPRDGKWNVHSHGSYLTGHRNCKRGFPNPALACLFHTQRKRSLRKKTLSASIKARRQSHHQARKLEVEKNDSDCTHSSTKRVSFSGKLSICTFDKRVLPHQSKSSVGTACRLYHSKTESHRYCGIVGSPSGVVDDAGAAG